jgi:hypothetical protein
VRVSLDARRICKDAEVGQTASPGVPLPFSFFLSFVIAGHSRLKNGVASLAYAPAIHTAKRLKQNLRWLTPFDVSMDHRIKSGGDEKIRA